MAIPTVEIVATVVVDELQVALAVILPVLVSENVPVAVNCCVAPTGTETFVGVREIELSVRMLCVRTGDVLPT